MQNAQEINDATLGNEESKRSLSEAQGRLAQPSDFDTTIETQQSQINVQEGILQASQSTLDNLLGNNDYLKGQYDSFMSDFTKGVIGSSDYADIMKYVESNQPGLYNWLTQGVEGLSLESVNEAFKNVISSSTELNNMQADLANTTTEQRESISNFSSAVDESLRSQLSDAQTRQESEYARTGIHDKKAIQDEIDLLTKEDGIINNIQRQRDDAMESYNRALQETADTVDEKTGESINTSAEQYLAQAREFERALDEARQELRSTTYDQLMAEGDDELLNIESLSSGYDTLMTKIEAMN